LTLGKLKEMQPSGELKESDARIIANLLYENFNKLPEIINLDNIVVHDQSTLKFWVIDFTYLLIKEQ
jgi:hypothetical protein